MSEMITISKKEYERLKALDVDSEDDFDYVASLEKSLDDIEAGRIIRVR